MPPTGVLGGGELVSRCTHTVGFRRLGPELSSCFSPYPHYRVQGYEGMSQFFSGGTKGAVLTSAAMAGPYQEGALLQILIETQPA